MLNIVKQLFGFGSKADFAQLVKEGAVIIDVRSKEEYQQGHIRGSQNIPLDKLSNRLSELKKDTPVITCCASGMRSALAKKILKSNGYAEVYNGGGWKGLQSKLSG